MFKPRHLAALALLAATILRPLPAHADSAASCAAALDGSPVQAAIAASRIPLVCEPRPADAPPVAGGYWDHFTIHLWPDGLQPALVRKLAAHELGHAWADHRPDLADRWYLLRGTDPFSTPAREDFAESFYRALFFDPALGFVSYGGLPPATSDQLAVMRAWFAAATRPASWTTFANKSPAAPIHWFL